MKKKPPKKAGELMYWHLQDRALPVRIPRYCRSTKNKDQESGQYKVLKKYGNKTTIKTQTLCEAFPMNPYHILKLRADRLRKKLDLLSRAVPPSLPATHKNRERLKRKLSTELEQLKRVADCRRWKTCNIIDNHVTFEDFAAICHGMHEEFKASTKSIDFVSEAIIEDDLFEGSGNIDLSQWLAAWCNIVDNADEVRITGVSPRRFLGWRSFREDVIKDWADKVLAQGSDAADQTETLDEDIENSDDGTETAVTKTIVLPPETTNEEMLGRRIKYDIVGEAKAEYYITFDIHPDDLSSYVAMMHQRLAEDEITLSQMPDSNTLKVSIPCLLGSSAFKEGIRDYTHLNEAADKAEKIQQAIIEIHKSMSLL